MSEQPEKKRSKLGFYFFMVLMLLCIAAYAGTPFFVHKVPQAADAPKPWPK